MLSEQPAVRVFISYAHDDSEHEQEVWEFYNFLRGLGIDARIDLVAAEQPQDWTLWMLEQIDAADFVLVIASPAYKQRAEGKTSDAIGRGAQWEAQLIREAYNSARSTARARFLPVILPDSNSDNLPTWIGPTSATHYYVSGYSVGGADRLIRYLTKQPRYQQPILGQVPMLGHDEDWGNAMKSAAGAQVPVTDSVVGEQVIRTFEESATDSDGQAGASAPVRVSRSGRYFEERDAGYRYLRKALAKELRPLLKGGRAFSVLMIDVDDLTQINKRCGRLVGDEVLNETGRLITSTISIWAAGRCGDDTFFAILHDVQLGASRRLAQGFCDKYVAHDWSSVESDLRVSCSIGCTQFDVSEPTDDAIARAVKGFQKAKADGGNRAAIGPRHIAPLMPHSPSTDLSKRRSASSIDHRDLYIPSESTAAIRHWDFS